MHVVCCMIRTFAQFPTRSRCHQHHEALWGLGAHNLMNFIQDDHLFKPIVLTLCLFKHSYGKWSVYRLSIMNLSPSMHAIYGNMDPINMPPLC